MLKDILISLSILTNEDVFRFDMKTLSPSSLKQ